MSPVLVRLFRRIVGASCKRDSEGMPFVAFFGIEELACLLAAHLAGRMLVVGTRFAGGRGRRRGWRRSGRRVAGARGGGRACCRPRGGESGCRWSCLAGAECPSGGRPAVGCPLGECPAAECPGAD